MADTTLLELGVVEVKPKYIVACLPELEHARKIYEKHGAKYHGVWIGEAGAACTIFSLVEWRNL